ncbi:transposase [Candidatus Woesearchaeota archaeon]|nr:transposase [Candidatus Woesearchaeota archaeon]
MDRDTNLRDFWQRDFWNSPIPNLKQSSLEEFRKAERLRKIKRDFTAINQAHQWEPYIFLKILNNTLLTLNLPNGYKGTGRKSVPLKEKIIIGCVKQYHLRGARRTVYHVKSAYNENYLKATNFSDNYFNRINDYINDPSLTPYIQKLITRLSEPLIQNENFFACDGTGFKESSGKRRYKDIRTDKEKKRSYTGLHAICGVNSHVIPYAIVAKGYEHDSKFFEELVLKTKEKFHIKEIYVDTAYHSKKHSFFCESLNIKLYVKPKENTVAKPMDYTSWKRDVIRYYEDAEQKEKRRYSLRANVEASFHMLKTVLSDFTRHKNHTARINELLLRVACHNIRCLILAYFHDKIDFPFDLDDSWRTSV